MRSRGQDKVKAGAGRSPAYPFVPLERALARAGELWRAVGRADMDVDSARQHWGYGPSSSGGIQTEAALKQFELLEVGGRGDERRLKLSELAVRLVGDRVSDASERRRLIEQAALNPKIHRELWERWRDVLPVAEVRRYLTKDRDPGFNEKGANDLIAEYQKTISYMGLVGSEPGTRQPADLKPEVDRDGVRTNPSSRSPDAGATSATAAMKENEINVRFDGNYLSVSAFVDRAGLRKLMKILEANRAVLEVGKDD